MKVKMDGFEELSKQLKKMEKGAKELESTDSVAFSELFTSSFMKENTNSNSVDEFFNKSQFTAETDADFEAIDEKELDEYVAQNSKFERWQEMLDSAGEEYAIRKLGL